MKKRLFGVILGGFMSVVASNLKETDLIPRAVLFGNPDKAAVSLRPDGKQVAFLAPHEGVLNIWVQDIENNQPARVITRNKDRGIQAFSWSYDNRYILYVIDQGGDENWNLHAVNLETGEDQALTNEKKAQTRVFALSRHQPTKAMIGLNTRDPRYHDVYEIDLQTNKKRLVYKNSEFGSLVFDRALKLSFATKPKSDGTVVYYYNKGTNECPEWKEFLEFSREEQGNSALLYVDEAGVYSYWLDARGCDKAVLKRIHLQTREEVVLASSEKADVNNALISYETDQPFVAYANYDKERAILLDGDFSDVFSAVEKQGKTDQFFLSSSLDQSRWLVKYFSDRAPAQYYVFDRKQQKFTFLFSGKKVLEAFNLEPMHFVEIKARDGLVLPSYLTLPKGVALKNTRPVPLVVDVHGGPWVRQVWGFNTLAQWLANRGYAVLQVNYRGSTGFGKDFVARSFGEWGTKMHEDILDAVQWAIDQGIADPKKVAIFGGSYGGYETLWAMAQSSDVFAMGASVVGPSNLKTLMNSIPAYWQSEYEWFVRAIGGDPKTPQGQKFLKERSPLTYAHQIKKPLLIAQGVNDVRVKKAESDQIVQMLKECYIPVTYLVYPNEGHGFVKKEERIYFFAVLEQMLAKILGGQFEPLKNEFEKAVVVVEENSLKLDVGSSKTWWQKIKSFLYKKRGA